MHPARRRVRTRVRLVGLAAVAALAATLTLSTGPVAAHDDDHEPSKSSDSRNCTKAERKLLKKAGDNFADACRPGKNLAAMNDSGADLAAGDWAAVDMKLLKNIPKQGAFASQTAFNSDLAFKGEYAYAGNYEGFMIYDLGNPSEPGAALPGGLPRLAERRVRVPQPARALHRLEPLGQQLRQRATAGDGEELVGGPEGLRHQRPDESEVHRRGGDPLRFAHPHARAEQERQRPCGSTSRRTSRTRRSPTASRRTTGSAS